MHKSTHDDYSAFLELFPNNTTSRQRVYNLERNRLSETNKAPCSHIHASQSGYSLCALSNHELRNHDLHHPAVGAVQFTVIHLDLFPFLPQLKQVTSQ